jgi:hypothetical protein
MTMKSISFAFVILSACMSLTVVAQDDDVHNQPGKIRDYSGKEGPPNLLNNNGIDPASLNEMNSASLKLIGVAENCPDLSRPRGYDLRVQVSVAKPSPYCVPLQQALTANNWLAIHEFYKDENGHLAVNGETGAGLHLIVNELLSLFPGDFNSECDAFRLPRFFFPGVFGIKESFGEYLLLNDGTRVVTNGKALFIAYSREQYLQFLVKKEEKRLQDLRKALLDLQGMKERAGNAAPAVAELVDKRITGATQAIAASEQKLTDLHTQLNSLSIEERRAQAYMVFSRNATAQPDRMYSLTTQDDKDGVALFTPNPEYFDAKLSKAAVQLITVTGKVDTRFVSKYYEDITLRVLESIDYKALKQLIQK